MCGVKTSWVLWKGRRLNDGRYLLVMIHYSDVMEELHHAGSWKLSSEPSPGLL